MPAPDRPSAADARRVDASVLRETYDEVVATGSQREVAKRHGWPQSKVRHRVLSWMAQAGIEGDPPGIVSQDHRERGSLSHSGQGDRSAWRRVNEENATLRARVAELEAEVRHWQAEAHPWVAVHARLAAIERAVTTRPQVVTHRRTADGGRGGRQEMRELRRTA